MQTATFLRRILPLVTTLLVAGSVADGFAATYYVRQSVGDDSNEGTSAAKSWQHLAKLSLAMRAGDTAYVGPGLYRESIFVDNSGRPDARLTFIADTTGQRTGDPPGAVLITGAEPVDEGIFVAAAAPGVYSAPFADFRVLGVTEMDGNQYRYLKVTITKEYRVDKMREVDIVAKFPSSFFYDAEAKVLWIHTSDGKPPKEHELELFRREDGIGVVGKSSTTIEGFFFRHMGDSGISFFEGAQDGLVINNTSFGNRQGVRVYGSSNISLYGNTFFRNENCGVYFAAASVSGTVIGNVAYENVKGIRWGSGSVNGLAVDNLLFDNLERGISIEDTKNVILLRNRLVNNKISQLMTFRAELDSESNCFANGSPEQLTAADYAGASYKTLADYQKAKRLDLHGREGDCGPLPRKIDVRQLHAQTSAYAECARKVLAGSAASCDREASVPAPGIAPKPKPSAPGAVPAPTAPD